jgi:hypothetical protein
MRKTAILVLAFGFVAAGCGGGDSPFGGLATTTASLDAEEAALAAALAAEIRANPDPGNPLPPGAADCVAAGWVAALGVGRFAELGATAGDLGRLDEAAFSAMTEAERLLMVDAALGCVDTEAMLVDEFMSGGLSREDSICIARDMAGGNAVRYAMLQGLIATPLSASQQAEFEGAVDAALSGCLSPEELADLRG